MTRRSYIIALVLFFVAVGGVLALSPGKTRSVQSTVLGLVSPFLRNGSALQKRFSAFREGLKSLSELEQENKLLVVQNKELKATNQTLRDLEQENNRLRRALEYRERAEFRLIPARIVARDSSTWWNTVKIDRGFDDGIKDDMPVLTEEGLIGKTTTVARNMATVILIADENCKVATKVEGSREQGIVKGARTSSTTLPQISLNFLTKDAGLVPGQKVFTSGVGGVYPAGILVGAIKEFKVRELDGAATVVPAVDLTSLEDVFVIAGKK